jgi:hypothetical protein
MRLTEPVGGFEIFPNAFGLTLVSLVARPEEAIIATRAIESALSLPVDSRVLDENIIGQVRKTLSSSSSPGAGELVLANCSGDLTVDPQQLDILNNRAELLASVERVRVEMHSPNNARFGFVGASVIAHAVERAVGQLSVWPGTQTLTQPGVEAPGKLGAITVTNGTLRNLSIAWRVGSIATANRAAQTMRRKGSPLLAQVGALDTEWKVDAISAIARNVGACLRIDLSTSSDASPISLRNLEDVARVTTSESRSSLQTSIKIVHDDTVNPIDNDPRIAARRAAWNSLSAPDRSQPQSLLIHLRTSQIDGPPAPLEAALRESLKVIPPRSLDAVSRLETGQSEQWALLASPCGTSAETADDAGSVAAWVRAISKRYSGYLGVQVEPWLTADGIGFIAHCHAQSRAESSSAMATRLGNALGSIVATGSVSGADLAAMREDTLLRLGPSPRRGWWQLVDLLSPGHPSTYEPLGSFDSMRKLDLANLRTSRLKWLRGPLRLSVLLNQDQSQLPQLTLPLHRWLDPHRTESKRCLETPQEVRQSSDVQISTRSLDTHDSNVYVAIQLAPGLRENLLYEHWLVWLLTRPGGWLERTLDQLGSLNSFGAEVRGRRQNRSLIISLTVADDSKMADGILRVRALFSRLADSGADAQEVGLAQSWSDAQIRRAEFDPRRRLVDLWRGDSVPQKTQLSGFSRYLNQSLGSAAVTVLRVRRQP